MVKIIIGLNRAGGTSFEEFERHWLEEHAPIAEGMPNLRKYTISLANEDDAAYDGFAELHFESEADMAEAMESDPGAEATADIPNFADPEDMLQVVTEEHVVVDRT